MFDGRDEALLLRRAKKGDRDAIDALIHKHEKRAYQYAFRLTRNPDEAADVVAEGFLRVCNALPKFKGQSAFSTWLYRILTNCFLDIRKRERCRPASSIESFAITPEGEFDRQIVDAARGPFDESERILKENTMKAAVARLPEYQRAIIVMYHVEMMTYTEMAEALDLPIGTVKSRLNRARISLRTLLAPHKELFAVA